jgi:hypothetical protein
MITSVMPPLPEPNHWTPLPLPQVLPVGDMPGDSIHITKEHISKANLIFPCLLRSLPTFLAANPHRRAVIAVCGGSGVGKSETAAILSQYLRDIGLGSYTLSGDNYPHRIPALNDAERLRVYRCGGMLGLVTAGQCTAAHCDTVRAFQKEQRDAEPALQAEHPWMAVYQQEGRKALAGYLGTENEIDFSLFTQLVSQFKNGADTLYLKRMGRAEDELWYDAVDVSDVRVLVIEWTHGNSNRYQGVDFPIFLNSTPEETRAYRKARHRDGGTDSAFTTMVLQLEQQQLEAQACKAGLIVAKNGELLNYPAYRRLMAAN